MVDWAVVCRDFGLNLGFKQGFWRDFDGKSRQWQTCIPFNKFADRVSMLII